MYRKYCTKPAFALPLLLTACLLASCTSETNPSDTALHPSQEVEADTEDDLPLLRSDPTHMPQSTMMPNPTIPVTLNPETDLIADTNDDDAEELPLLDTASVLFPWFRISDAVIDPQVKTFITHTTEISPTRFEVTKVTDLREGPGIAFSVKDILTPGQKVTVDAQLAHWYHLADNSGYVSGLDIAPLGADGKAQTSDIVWSTTVSNSGDVDEIDTCQGGLTEITEMSSALERPVYAIHSYCGGDPILTLHPNDIITIDNNKYNVVAAKDFPLFGNSTLIEGLPGSIYIQTSDLVYGHNHVVGVDPVNSANPGSQ